MLKDLSQKFGKNQAKIMAWIEKHTKEVKDPIYSSVDVRNAGFKVAPVDTNIFPGGFNNLCPSYQKRTGELMKKHIDKHYPETKKILLIPENHTRNTYYFSNLKKIQTVLKEAGFEVQIGSLNPEIKEKSIFTSSDNEEITLFPINRDENTLKAGRFSADLYLLNNDLSSGIPEILKGLARPLIPSPHTGWHRRKKSDHFTLYSQLIKEFAEIIDLDPWFLQADFSVANEVDFATKDGLEKIAVEVDLLIKKIAQKYKDYKIDEIPYVFIKNNSGTYGMGITNARSGAQILELNRKDRNKLGSAKAGQKTSSVIIQEGIPTTDRFKDLVAEPVIYLANNEVAGGFFRLNDQKSYRANLNSKGMKFSKLCFHEMLGYSNTYVENCDLECLSLTYKNIAQIASFAAGYETLKLESENEN